MKPRMSAVILLLLGFLLLNPIVVLGGDYNDTRTLFKDLLDRYDKDIRPVENQSEPITVDIQMYVKSIQEFDEVKGMFSFIASIYISWLDISMVWDPEDYGGVSEITFPIKDVWVPELILLSPSASIDSLGKTWNRVRFQHTGQVMWLPVDIIKSTCSVNVQNYPFDTQICVASFNNIQYYRSELVLTANKSTIDTSIYQENSLWDLTATEASINTNNPDGFQIDFKFHMQRKSTYLVISLVLPILFLNLLNVLVFLLVPESGERASYSITVLLSIAVFMTIISDTLPSISKPVAYISYKLMIDMVISSTIVLVMILNLRLFSRDEKDPVPGWLKSFYVAMTWCGHRHIKTGDTPLKPHLPRAKDNTDSNTDSAIHEKHVPNPADGNDEHSNDQTLSALTYHEIRRSQVTWKKISYLFDWIALVFFTLASLTSFVTFIAVTQLTNTFRHANNYG